MTEQMSLEVFNPLKAAITELQQKDESQEFDHTTEPGEKALRSWVHRVRGIKGDIEKVRKATKADALAFGRKVDEMARELTAVPEKIIAERMKPLDEIEAKKRAEAEAVVEAERLAEEKAEQERVADLERREALADKKEAEFKEKERVAREKQFAAAAAEKERKEAERVAANQAKVVEQEKAQAIEKAEREKGEAIEAEKEKARKAEAAAASERQRIADEASQKAENELQAKIAADKIEADRAADENHRADVQILICNSIIKHAECDKQTAENVIAAIVRGEIPNLTINY